MNRHRFGVLITVILTFGSLTTLPATALDDVSIYGNAVVDSFNNIADPEDPFLFQSKVKIDAGVSGDVTYGTMRYTQHVVGGLPVEFSFNARSTLRVVSIVETTMVAFDDVTQTFGVEFDVLEITTVCEGTTGPLFLCNDIFTGEPLTRVFGIAIDASGAAVRWIDQGFATRIRGRISID